LYVSGKHARFVARRMRGSRKASGATACEMVSGRIARHASGLMNKVSSIRLRVRQN
jgi:hypothetical protein